MKIGLQAWGSEGDIRPFTALAAGLVKNGHDVTLAITDNAGRDYSELAIRFGYRQLTVLNPEIASPEQVERVWRQIIELGNPIQQAELVMKYGFDPAMEAMYSAARQLCATSDLVVGHFFVFPLRVAARKAGVPMATLNIVHNCVPSAEIRPPGLPDLGGWSYPLGWKLVQKMVNRIFLPRVNALGSREGLPPDRDVMTQTWAAERLNLIAVSPAICRRPSDWEPRHQVCGFLNLPAELVPKYLPEGLDDFLASGAPPVYITFGSMMINNLDFMQEAARIWTDAIAEVGCRAIFQLPWNDLSVFKTNHRIFKVKWAPYRLLFPRCSLIVHHGGAGTTQSTLLAGRPSIIVAHMADQFFWGSELERLGVAGKTLKRKGLTSKRMARGINQVLVSPEMETRANNLGAQMAQENGVSTAVRLIEERLATDESAARQLPVGFVDVKSPSRR